MKIKPKHIFITLLALHALWLSAHLYLSTSDLLNPWKLGGYGMYVEPKRSSYVTIYEPRSDSYELTEGAYTYEFIRQNWNFNLYCKNPSTDSLRQFFRDNSDLAGLDIALEIRTPKFVSKPALDVKWEKRGQVNVSWPNEDTLAYQNNICGHEYPLVMTHFEPNR